MFARKIYEKDLKEIQSERGPVFRESNIGWPSESLVSLGPINEGECRRALFYKILGVPYSDDKSARLKTICDAGNMYEDYAIRKFKDLNLFVEEQVRIEYIAPGTQNNIILSGKMDAVIQEDGIKKGIEIKTVYGYKADMIWGGRDRKNTPIPSPNNLMQAMLYKYYYKHINTEAGIEEVYLMYINRGTGESIYFKVDLDNDGWPIITAIRDDGHQYTSIRLKDVPSYEDLRTAGVTAKSTDSKLASLRININEIFKKYDETYSYARERVLPPKDYQLQYDAERVELERRVGRLSAQKYNAFKKKGTPCGDARCSFCNYRKKCLGDSNIKITDVASSLR